MNVDTSAPVLTLNGSETVIVEVGASYTDQGAIRTDNYDGTGTVYAFSGSVNTGIVGEYVLYYRYIDADDNVGTITRTVKVVDTQKPVITLNGSGEITLEVHSNYNEQ
ncbi:MAG: DUF5011 domain-containing protein [Candidatus Peribacteria bacterium]|nr:DUF5011 domain-containing protein [Candidatus Peribacteria bacterium]